MNNSGMFSVRTWTTVVAAAAILTCSREVTINNTPLDDRELKSSRHVLVTALARDKQTGTKYNAARSNLDVVGGPPLLLEPVQATITLKGLRPKEVNVLDFFGVPTGRKVKLAGSSFTIDGTHRTYYYEVKR